MKKKLLALAVAAIASFSLFAYSCGDKTDDTVYPTDGNGLKEISLSYDVSSGTLSWEEVENAANYKVKVAPHGKDPIEKETGETSLFVALKRGVNRAAVYAYDSGKTALAVGSASYSLEYDYGAPEAPENLVFDAAAKTLKWNAVENATKYIVSATCFADDAFSIEKTCETNEVTIEEINRGIYYFTVYGVSGDGAQGRQAELSYRSFTDKKAGTFTADGLRYLLGFEDANVADLSRASVWQAWGTKDDLAATAEKTPEELVKEIEQDETIEESDKDFYLKRLDHVINGKAEAQKSGEPFYTLLQGGKKGFAGVTFELGTTIALKDLRNLSFKTFFTTGDSLDVVLGDGENTVFVKIDPSHAGTSIAFDIPADEFKAKDVLPQTITQISFVTHCANAYSGYFIGDISYGLKGDIGKAVYDATSSVISWPAADGATSYKVVLDGNEVYSGKECGFSYRLSSGKHRLVIVADNGAESIQTIEGLTFDSGDKKKVLADFKSALYSDYIDNAPADYSIDTETGALVKKSDNSGLWKSGGIRYILPRAIELSAIESLSFKIKADDLEHFCIYLADESDNAVYVYYKSTGVTVGEKDENGFVVLTVTLSKRLSDDSSNFFTEQSSFLKGLYLGARIASEIAFGEISYVATGENIGGARSDWGW